MATPTKLFYTINMKECRNCHKILPESDFNVNRKNKDGLTSYCKKCIAEKAKIYNKTRGKEKLKQIHQKQLESGYFVYGHGAYSNKKRSALKRGISFNISEDEYRKWWMDTSDCCYYCGCSLQEYKNQRDFVLKYQGNNKTILEIQKNVFNTDRAKNISVMTVDRKDSKKGYETNNIVKSCWICNSIKSNKFSEEDAKILLKKIKDKINKEMRNAQNKDK